MSTRKFTETSFYQDIQNLKKDNDYLREQINKMTNKTNSQNNYKIFISHNSADEEFGNAIYELLIAIGLKDENIFFSSRRKTGVPVSKNLLDTIKNELINFDTIVFIIHSQNYYESPICLNEMGAAWILNRQIFSFLTKNFNFNDLTGVINKYDICFKTGNKDSNTILDEIILFIQTAFKLEKINDETIDNIKNKFLAKVSIL